MSARRIRPLDTIVVGQGRALVPLQRALESDELFPSLVFHGPPGVGKLTTALLLGRALLCQAGSDRPCGTCRSCRRIDAHSLVHPDVRLILPEKKSDFDHPAEGEEGVPGFDPQESQTEAIDNPVWSVLIDRVRQGIRFVQRRPAESGRSLLIVDQAHRMEAAAANALLKTLEEPPPHAVIVLCTPSWHALLPTVRSRCQAIPFQPVPRSSVVSYLVERLEMGAEESVLRAGLCDGRIGEAIGLELHEFRARREALLGLLDDLTRRGDAGIAVARAESLVHGGEGLERDLGVLSTLLRDTLLMSVSPGSVARLINVDLEPQLAQLAGRIGPGVGAAILELESTLDAIRHKGNRQLLIENFLLTLLPAPPPRAAVGRGPAPARG